MAKHIGIIAALMLSGTAAAAVAGHGQFVAAEPLTLERIARLPAGEQPAWRAYLARSKAQMAADKAVLAAELRETGGPLTYAPIGTSGGGGMPLDRPADWYATAEARQVADNIVSYQTPAGGWGKNQDRDAPARVKGQHWIDGKGTEPDIAHADWNYVGTIDNNATTSELRFLARVQAQLPGVEGDPYRASIMRGVTYLLVAQYPNGGWPQVYPLMGGYHDALTYNDDALVSVVELLDDVARGKADFGFLSEPARAAAAAAVDRACDVILASQVVVDGRRTIWGQQHDPLTLAPSAARNFEPPALSSSESTSLLMFLMTRENPTPEMAAAIEAGVAWLGAHSLSDVVYNRKTEAPEGPRLLPSPGAEPLWPRYYDVKSFVPIFGDRDKSVHTNVDELSLERRRGYAWFNTEPRKLPGAYAKWRKRRGL